MALTCETKRLRVLACRREPVDRCTYCGRYFCVAHGDVNRRVCLGCLPAFWRDAAREAGEILEQRRRQVGASLNAKGLCGWEGCGGLSLTSCDRCRVYYCSRHVSRYGYSYRHKTLAGTRMRKGYVVLCDSCAVFLDDYKRDRYSLV